MDWTRWLLRASRWSRRPPSAARVKLVLAVIAAGLLILAAERLGLWPDWAQMEPQGRRPHFELPPPGQP